MDAVMQAVRDYGRGHTTLLYPSPSEKPTEDSQSYYSRINSLLVQRDFAQLEKIALQNRTEKGRLVGGYWENYEFFNITRTPVREGSELKESDYKVRFDLVNQWIAAFPQSAAARLTLANLYMSDAFFARGSGLAETVSDHQWVLFNERVAKTRQTLIAAASLKERDRQWYCAMLELAQAEGWDKADTRELFEQAVAFEPEYYHFHKLYSLYLLPQWYGEPGEIQRFAEEASARLPEPNSSILYFQIMSTYACYCKPQLQGLIDASYPKILRGYTSLTEQFGNSNLIANRFAVMAWAFNDKNSVREAFTHISAREPDAFLTQDTFDYVRQWPDAP